MKKVSTVAAKQANIRGHDALLGVLDSVRGKLLSVERSF
jgi:hypothetical protein